MSALGDDAGAPIGCGCALLSLAAAICMCAITDWLIDNGDRILTLIEAGGLP